MSAFGRMHKATAILPLAVLSTAWTASLAGVGAGTALADDAAATLPDGTSLPTSAIEAPASVSLPGVVAPGVPAGQAGQAVSTASTSGIPSAALAAYQRAEAVINAADKGCHLPWQLIAAIGRVESDHGRFGGNVLNDEGLAEPGIYGIALNGKRNTQVIADTDAGQYDNDTTFDRAVGPMQFIPSTWSVVGVDGDGDGKRNPQDIDDAALATAVYLCSGDDDLSGEQGQRASVFRYNHSNEYVDLVLSLMQAYMDGDFTSVPTRTSAAGVFLPDPTRPSTGPAKGTKGQGTKGQGGATATATGGGGGGGGGSTSTTTSVPTAAPTPTATPTPAPTGTGGNNNGPVKVPSVPVPAPSTSLPTVGAPPVATLTFAEALAQCTAQGVLDNPLTANNELADCANALLAP